MKSREKLRQNRSKKKKLSSSKRTIRKRNRYSLSSTL